MKTKWRSVKAAPLRQYPYMSHPDTAPLVLHWSWLEWICQGSTLALLDQHQAHYQINTLLELHELLRWQANGSQHWRRIDACQVACEHCGLLSPLVYTPANRRDFTWSLPGPYAVRPSVLVFQGAQEALLP